MEQLAFIFDLEQNQSLKGLVVKCAQDVKKKYPSPMKGETLEDYQLFIRDETLLEISERLREIALRRQKKSINILYKGKNDEF